MFEAILGVLCVEDEEVCWFCHPGYHFGPWGTHPMLPLVGHGIVCGLSLLSTVGASDSVSLLGGWGNTALWLMAEYSIVKSRGLNVSVQPLDCLKCSLFLAWSKAIISVGLSTHFHLVYVLELLMGLTGTITCERPPSAHNLLACLQFSKTFLTSCTPLIFLATLVLPWALYLSANKFWCSLWRFLVSNSSCNAAFNWRVAQARAFWHNSRVSGTFNSLKACRSL